MIALAFTLIVAPTPYMSDDKASLAESRRGLARYVKCLFRQEEYRFRPALEWTVGVTDENKRWGPLVPPVCMDNLTDSPRSSSSELHFRPNLVRGILYEIMLSKDFGNAPVVDSFEDVPPITYPRMAQPSGQVAAAYAVTTDIGECTVRAAVTASHALLATEITSAAEMAAVKELVPTINQCTPTGTSLTFSLPIIRGMISESMYRLTKAKLGAKDK